MNRAVFRFCRVVAVAMAIAAVMMVAGCSSGAHAVVDSGKACTDCHSEKQTYDSAVPSNAVKSNGTVVVRTASSEVYVCEPVFTAADGSKYTPVAKSTVSVTDGQAEVRLDDGVWALCAKKGSSSVGQIVVVSKDSAENASITL